MLLVIKIGMICASILYATLKYFLFLLHLIYISNMISVNVYLFLNVWLYLINAGAGMRHGIMAAPGGKPQNIQLVKTMLSQPGGKPGQTTILLAQPGGQPATMLASSTDSLTQAIRTVNVSQANAKNKGAPVYARIITPRPCMRLAAVRPGQLQQCQVNQAQNISVLQAINRLQAPVDGQPQVVTLTTQPAPSPAPAQPKPPEHMQTDP